MARVGDRVDKECDVSVLWGEGDDATFGVVRNGWYWESSRS